MQSDTVTMVRQPVDTHETNRLISSEKVDGTAVYNGEGQHLGNTPAVCRRCYIHPEIFEGYFGGALLATLAEKTGLY